MCLKILPTQVREHCINATGMTVIVTNKAGCPVPSFSYFLSLFLFSPIFKLKPPIFPIFLAGEGKICNKIENGIIVVCVFE